MLSFFKATGNHGSLKAGLKNILGYKPKHLGLYKTAMVHGSVSKELPNGVNGNNERLEFLGDAIIDAATAEYLYLRYPNKQEGSLSQLRSKLVNRKTLNKLALQSGLEKYAFVRPDINVTNNNHISGNLIEALIGAVFLDKGYVKAKQVFIKQLLEKYADVEQLLQEVADYKSRLIEWGQKYKQQVCFTSTEDRMVKSENRRIFTSQVTVNGELVSMGRGYSKKEAEQNAAGNALEKLSIAL